MTSKELSAFRTHSALLKYFKEYTGKQAPFMHQQLIDWHNQHPYDGIHVLHHVPVVSNTLLKIACLIEAGATVTVTNPFYLPALLILRRLQVYELLVYVM